MTNSTLEIDEVIADEETQLRQTAAESGSWKRLVYVVRPVGF